MPYAEKVRSLELLGVAESVIGAGAYRYNVNRAHEAFCRALECRESSSKELVERKINSNLVNCLTHSRAKKCVSLNEMLAIKHDENAIRVHSFLVGDRVLYLKANRRENYGHNYLTMQSSDGLYIM